MQIVYVMLSQIKGGRVYHLNRVSSVSEEHDPCSAVHGEAPVIEGNSMLLNLA